MFKGLIYGPSGVGKTVVASTIVEVTTAQPCCFMSFENRLESVKDKVHLIELNDMHSDVKEDKLNTVIINSEAKFEKFIEMVSKKPDYYKSYIVDSATQFNYYCVYGWPNKNPLKFIDTGFRRPLYDDYHRALENTRSLFEGFRDLEGCHVVYTANVRDAETPGLAGSWAYPLFYPEKAPEHVMALLDYVFYLQINAMGQRELVTNQQPGIRAKECSNGRLPKVLKPDKDETRPTMAQLLKLLNYYE